MDSCAPSITVRIGKRESAHKDRKKEETTWIVVAGEIKAGRGAGQSFQLFQPHWYFVFTELLVSHAKMAGSDLRLPSEYLHASHRAYLIP